MCIIALCQADVVIAYERKPKSPPKRFREAIRDEILSVMMNGPGRHCWNIEDGQSAYWDDITETQGNTSRRCYHASDSLS